jgi:rubrerythrin
MERMEAFDGRMAWYECERCGFRPIATESVTACPRCEEPL